MSTVAFHHRPNRPARSADGWRIGPRSLEVSRRDLGCPIHQSLERWVARTLGSIDHERRVADLATDLFDVLADLHRLEAADLRLLRWSAIVHDVGRAICDDDHPEVGARLVRAERSLPLSPSERRRLAYLTLHHRGKAPTPGTCGVLAESDDRDRMYRTLALLKAADGLDNRELASRFDVPPRVVFALARRSGRHVLHVTSYLDHDSDKARKVYGRRKKFRLLEELLGCEVEPTVIVARTAKWVA